MSTFLQTKEDITNWLDQHYIENYELIASEQYGFVVKVSGDVDLFGRKLSHIPVKFAHVDGDFYCDGNQLTSLEFCPVYVGEDFNCGYNQLTSLKFCPLHVGSDFTCHHNQLTSLEFCPTHVGGHFYCGNNQLTSLEFCPVYVNFDFYCDNNPLLQEIQDITDFNEIYQLHQETKIKLAKERLEQKLSDKTLTASQTHSVIKI